jgi:hypothetical protein
MSDKFTTVATFNNTVEAQLAKNLLENEGIECIVVGGFSSDVFFGSITAGDPIGLQVQEEDAKRAAGVLAAVAAARLDDDWEERAESDAGVWICSMCGEPISNRLSICHSCQTPRESIRAAAPRDVTAIRPDAATLPTGKAAQKRDEIADTPAPTPDLAPAAAATVTEEEEPGLLPTAYGDNLAYKALIASLIGIILPIMMPIALFFLLRVVLFTGEMSAKGVRQFYAAFLINGSIFFIVLFLCAGGWRLF